MVTANILTCQLYVQLQLPTHTVTWPRVCMNMDIKQNTTDHQRQAELSFMTGVMSNIKTLQDVAHAN